ISPRPLSVEEVSLHRSGTPMAKHCTVCNQAYAEELTACPHCASASGVRLSSGPPSSGIAFGPASDRGRRDPDSAEWNPVIDAAGSSSGSAHGSEVDLGPQFTRSKHPSPADVQLDAARQEDGSDVDLGKTPVRSARGNSSAAKSGPPSSTSSGSYVESSAVDLGGPPRGRSPLSSGLRLSGLGAEPVVPSSDQLPENPGHSDLGSSDSLDYLEDGSHVDLGSPRAPAADRPSGRDLIAEAVESGTDLLGTGAASAGLMPAEEMHFAQRMSRHEAGEDEMVDLGAPQPEED